MGKILNLVRDRPLLSGATAWQIYRGRAKEKLAQLLDWLKIPARIRSVKIDDSLTGDSIEIKPSGLFTKLTVNGRDYYFDRFTGRFDGTGQGCG